MHPAAEVGAVVSSPRSPAAAQGAAAEATGGGGRREREDEAAPGGEREQAETAGGYEEGTCPGSTSTGFDKEAFWGPESIRTTRLVYTGVVGQIMFQSQTATIFSLQQEVAPFNRMWCPNI